MPIATQAQIRETLKKMKAAAQELERLEQADEPMTTDSSFLHLMRLVIAELRSRVEGGGDEC